MEQGGCSEHMRETSGVPDTIDIGWSIDLFEKLIPPAFKPGTGGIQKQKKSANGQHFHFLWEYPITWWEGQTNQGTTLPVRQLALSQKISKRKEREKSWWLLSFPFLLSPSLIRWLRVTRLFTRQREVRSMSCNCYILGRVLIAPSIFGRHFFGPRM